MAGKTSKPPRAQAKKPTARSKAAPAKKTTKKTPAKGTVKKTPVKTPKKAPAKTAPAKKAPPKAVASKKTTINTPTAAKKAVPDRKPENITPNIEKPLQHRRPLLVFPK